MSGVIPLPPICIDYVYKNNFTFTVLSVFVSVCVGIENVKKPPVVCLISLSPNE
jgi:hypothetical protein